MKILDLPQSGSVGGVTHSRNRFGQYTRARAIPVNPNTARQGVVRARLGLNAAAWRTLTDAQRAGWETLGGTWTRNDSLGSSYTFNGFMAYCSVNNTRQAAGDAVVSDAPALVTPPGLLTATITMTAAAMSIAYTATPLAAGVRLFSNISPQQSAGRSFCKNFRLVAVSAAAAASPANVYAAYVVLFGLPIVGQRVFFDLRLYQSGFLSAPLLVTQTVA